MIKLRKIVAFVFTLLSAFTFGKVGLGSYIMFPNYIIGRKKIFIGNKVRILYGFRCEVFKDGNIVISDNCSIGHNLHMTACADLYLGSDCVISSNVFIGALDHDFTVLNVSVMSEPLVCKNTYIGSFSFIGTGAVILSGSHIGKNSIVGANSVVNGFFPDNSIIVGNPAKILRSRE